MKTNFWFRRCLRGVAFASLLVMGGSVLAEVDPGTAKSSLAPAPVDTNAAANADFYADEALWFKVVGDWANGRGTRVNDFKARAEFKFFKDDPALPRVLLIGDSISMRYTVGVQTALAGKANVHRIPANGGPTSRLLPNLPAILGKGKWDLIHFNCGLHDVWRRPKQETPGAPPDLTIPRQVSPEDYEKNLEAIIGKLQATGARLVFANTTPVPDRSSPVRTDADVVAYNEIAARVMAKHKIPVTELYGFCKPRMEELFPADNVHPYDKKAAIIGERVAEGILKVLEGRK